MSKRRSWRRKQINLIYLGTFIAAILLALIIRVVTQSAMDLTVMLLGAGFILALLFFFFIASKRS